MLKNNGFEQGSALLCMALSTSRDISALRDLSIGRLKLRKL